MSPMHEEPKHETAGKGHPLPASVEAKHDEIPDKAETLKGLGDDPAAKVSPEPHGANPDGSSYPD